MEPRKATSEARQRILETADRLFYQVGLRAVGIDRIIAEAEVAKMSLYKHFASKDDLILAVLQYRESCVNEFFTTAVERHSRRTRDRLRAFFAALKEWFERPDFRGCAFINAAVELANPEHEGARFVRDQKLRFRKFLEGLIRDAVGPGSARTAAAVALLVEGAVVTAVIQGSADSADVARDAALQLVTASASR